MLPHGRVTVVLDLLFQLGEEGIWVFIIIR